MDGQHAAPFIHIAPRNADALPARTRQKPALDLLRDRIDGVTARRKERVRDLLPRGNERSLRALRPTAFAEKAEHAPEVGAQRLVRPHAQFVELFQIDMADGVHEPRRKKFQHGI